MAKWYVIHTLSGSEKRVKQMILDQIARQNMSEYFEDIIVPIIEVPEVKKGKVTTAEKKLMPGYLLVHMQMTDESWHLVTSVSKTTGFLGSSKSKPQALSEKEIKNIFEQLKSEAKNITAAKLYEIGEQITVNDGPFEGFTGVVEELDTDKQRVKVAVSIFGKPTPIDLSWTQVRKMKLKDE